MTLSLLAFYAVISLWFCVWLDETAQYKRIELSGLGLTVGALLWPVLLPIALGRLAR